MGFGKNSRLVGLRKIRNWRVKLKSKFLMLFVIRNLLMFGVWKVFIVGRWIMFISLLKVCSLIVWL